MQQQQYYPTAVPRHGEPVYHPGGYHIHPAATARMQWSPNVQTGQWAYDLTGAYPGYAGHVPSSMGLSSPDPQSAATPHNIRDILGPGGQTTETLASEIAKTPSSYQKSPSSAGAATGTVFHYPTPASGDIRSPTTPNHPDIPQGFYIPALQGRPFGKSGFNYKSLLTTSCFELGVAFKGSLPMAH